MDEARPIPPRPPRSFLVHWAVDAAVAFLAVVVVALLVGIPLVPVAIAAVIIGLIAAPYTRRAEIRALHARDEARDQDPEQP